MAIIPLKKDLEQDLKSAVIANSQTITVGDFVVSGTGAASEFISEATNSSVKLLGGVVSITGDKGILLEKNQVVVASDNQTVGKIQASYIPSYIPMEFEADIDAAAGTTTGSDGNGFFTLVSGNGGVLDEDTWVTIGATASHFFSFGVTPYSSTKVFAHPYLSI